jgi:tryptophan synthase beta subunit
MIEIGAQADEGMSAVVTIIILLSNPVYLMTLCWCLRVTQVGIEPAGEGLDRPGRHAATLTNGKPGELHGMACYVLEDEEGKPAAVHSIASGLDYPGVGPQHSYLKDLGRASYESATDTETLEAFMMLSRVEGTSFHFFQYIEFHVL